MSRQVQLLVFYSLGLLIGFVLSHLLLGCDQPPMATGVAEVKHTLDAECKDAIRTYNLLDKAAEAYWYAHNLEAMDEVYDKIVEHIDAHRRCFW